MNIRARVEQTDSIEITVAVTASIREWRLIVRDLKSSHPALAFSNEVVRAISRVETESLGPFVEVADESR